MPKRNVQDQVNAFFYAVEFLAVWFWFSFELSSRSLSLPLQFVLQLLNSQVTTAQHMERERAYDIVSLVYLNLGS